MDIFKLEALNKAALSLSRMVFVGSSVVLTSNALADETLEEIVVTAQKREQNAQDIPMNINTLVNETLDNLNIKDFADYVLQFCLLYTSPSQRDATLSRMPSSA